MDSLTAIQARLKELIDAKIERRQALLDEAAAIDRELAEARRVLNGWDATQEMVSALEQLPETMVEATPKVKPKKEPHVVRMHRDDCVAFIRSKGGPVHWREALDHFGIRDGRGSAMLRLWSKDGHLVNCGDGFFTVPGPVAVEISA